MPNINWYEDPFPYTGPFPDTHVISHFAADIITYEEPTIPQDRQKLKSEPLAIQILCTHHRIHNIVTPQQINKLIITFETLQIPQYHIHNASSISHNTPVNKSKE